MIHPLTRHLNTASFLLSPAARPLRFAGTGTLAGACQILLLMVFTRHGWDAIAANGIAFVLAAQFNFALSHMLTWRDRAASTPILHRWLLFHVSIAAMAVLNMLTFATAHAFMPALEASLLGIAAGAAGNYVAGDRLVFREARSIPATNERRYAS